MIKLQDWRGMKFPDEFLVRAFFKTKLAQKKGNCLELGCAGGINLALFSEYGWDVIGIDKNQSSIDDANENFSKLRNSAHIDGSFDFYKTDMVSYLDKSTAQFDAVIFPSSLYYQKHGSVIHCLKKLPSVLKDNGFFFFHMRNKNDYRFTHCVKTDNTSVKIDFDETGEQGCDMSFYSPDEFVNILECFIKIQDSVLLKLNFQNIQNNKVTDNSDFILWGRKG